MEEVRIAGEEMTDMIKQYVQRELMAQWQRDWLGGEDGGRIAFIKWDGGRAQDGNEGIQDGNREAVKKEYQICFKDWTTVGQGIPLRPPSDFPDPFAPHQLAMVDAMVWSRVSRTAPGLVKGEGSSF
ncbi:hypothetical protein CBR_g24033 [Chara braunii]|uniref:Uncharacterized protein n=1 Tax=Chara braunii TaxID=69332 RepID=A0A388L5K6_CHABU|nr:hypothetical protein CBR_g24033 [Chara braunii]|eukprot:GBG77586.1 hypothetical protein CBR_g24033 [Chara braunii]